MSGQAAGQRGQLATRDTFYPRSEGGNALHPEAQSRCSYRGNPADETARRNLPRRGPFGVAARWSSRNGRRKWRRHSREPAGEGRRRRRAHPGPGRPGHLLRRHHQGGRPDSSRVAPGSARGSPRPSAQRRRSCPFNREGRYCRRSGRPWTGRPTEADKTLQDECYRFLKRSLEELQVDWTPGGGQGASRGAR